MARTKQRTTKTIQEQNKEQINEKQKQYYDLNRELINEKINCDICNLELNRRSLKRHIRLKD